MNDASGADGGVPDGAPAPGAPPPVTIAKGRDLTVALLRPIGAAVVLLIGYFLLPINKASDLNILGMTVGAGLLTAFCLWEVHRFARSVHPVATAMEMLVALATFYVTAFAATYFLFSEYDPGSFNAQLTRVDALYFCLTVFTTTGFGDIAADSQGARIAVSIQMASTLILLGLGLRFLNLLINQKRQATAG
ncbi:ion channel [Gordonia sp. C13]|uniref:ion channel n=1 Tax=Gordonia sp. C13 TaxID=2935078 RepID=UPI00200A8046|nr:potassium channel family protein [Gordonia sp. C13]MCK8614832.1 potassium channel family protein [Gordonia sp. C13]